MLSRLSDKSSLHDAVAEFKTFIYFQISCDEYEDQNQSIPGVKELSNMFRFYKQARSDRDLEQSRELNPKLSNLDDWVKQNKEKLLKALEENDKLTAES